MAKPTRDPSVDRRDFLKITAGAAAGLAAGSVVAPEAKASPALPFNPATPEAMPTRNLGKTGYRVGLFSLGGQATLEKPGTDEQSIAIVNRAIDLGVNYIDTAAFYGSGLSQKYIGQVMKTRRKEVFLATKSHDRTRDGSLRLLEESLKLLQTDHLDLWQIHNISHKEQVDQVFGKGGAIEAFQQAREQKITRYLGVTGHADPDALLAFVERFPFDTILLALNAADPHHRSFTEKLLPAAVEKNMGIIGMKIPARGRILSSWKPGSDNDHFAGEAKDPGTISMREAMYYTLSLPVSTVIIGIDNVAQLEENIALAKGFTPLSQTQLASLEKRTEPIARQALFFRTWS